MTISSLQPRPSSMGIIPIARHLYMYTRGEPQGQQKDYLDWILSIGRAGDRHRTGICASIRRIELMKRTERLDHKHDQHRGLIQHPLRDADLYFSDAGRPARAERDDPSRPFSPHAGIQLKICLASSRSSADR